ncbi:MAG: hypothetical protein ABR520_04640 [Mycobacteriales bacterium]|nr:hypothetical protein [Frankia sp.]
MAKDLVGTGRSPWGGYVGGRLPDELPPVPEAWRAKPKKTKTNKDAGSNSERKAVKRVAKATRKKAS